MSNYSTPLQMPSVGGGRLRRRQWRDALLIGLGLALLLVIYLASRPRVAPQPIANLQKNGVHGVYNVRAKNGELLFFNFRAVDEGKVYRSSGFPRNHRGRLNGKMGLHPAAAFHSEAFDFLRARNIRTVISLDSEKEAATLSGYFDYWAPKKGYRIRLINYPVPPERAYARDKSEQQGGLRRAIQIMNFMKSRSEKGAVLVMGEAGKDAVGVVAAAYELWRNVGHAPADELWTQVLDRYLVSDVLIKRDKKAMKFSSKAKCKGPKYTYVCPESIEAMRLDLERIAQMN